MADTAERIARRGGDAGATVACPRCNGKGRIPERVWTGVHQRERRNDLGITLEQIAGALGYSKSYISDLELGRREWTDDLIERYDRALTKAAAR